MVRTRMDGGESWPRMNADGRGSMRGMGMMVAEIAVMEIDVSETVRRHVEEQVAKGNWPDAGAYVAALVDADRRRVIRAEVEGKLLEAVRSESEPVTPEMFERIRREGRRMIEERKRM